MKKLLCLTFLITFVTTGFSQILKPQRTYVPIYKSVRGIQQVDSIISDFDKDMIPIITVKKIKKGYACIEFNRTAQDSLSAHYGWIELKLLGINPSTNNSKIYLRKSPNYKSPIVDIIENPAWGDLYSFTKERKGWLYINTVLNTGEIKKGWMSPEDQNDNPLTIGC